MAPDWVLDAAVCSTLSLGSPLVSISALDDLHGVLVSLGFRRGFVDGESTKEASHDPGTNTPSTTAAALSAKSGRADDVRREVSCPKRTGATAADGGRSGTGGDKR